MDYSKVVAQRDRGTLIGQLYVDASPEVDITTRLAYVEMIKQVDDQFRRMSQRIKVTMQDADPYTCADEMFADVDAGHLRVYRTAPDQQHPIFSGGQNDRFRAVHDFYGHHAIRRGFDRHGEEAAWLHHSRMFYGPARRAMTSETRGQNSVFIWLNQGLEFPAQKACLLPEWVSEIPKEYR